MFRYASTRSRAALIAVPTFAVAVALSACGGGTGTSSTSASNLGGPKRAIPVAVTSDQLRAVAASAGHPLYWAGPARGTYELTTIADGRTYIRYLPPGAPVGSSHTHLTIGTYVLSSPPYAVVHRAALAKRATIKALGHAALAVQYHVRPQSVYLVFPGANYEVEVYDPSPATALRLATTGRVVPIP
jgi:hypothetical protein